MKFVVTDEEIKTDLPYGTLNISSSEEKGFRPFQLLVSSIAGCSALVLQRIFKKQRLTIDMFTIEAIVERNEARADRIEKIHLIYTIKGNSLDEEKMLRNLDLARRHCSMIRSVEDSIEIVETLQLQ